ncbi:probable RNA helicase armi [Plutella xylostella]|uniref:probable RNA helicase armi n=1 Tax=Plutella xylostella TaxID=51655 RepID=UPI0020324B09|nr:probable RNA helicase armi [Plutella xylostella]
MLFYLKNIYNYLFGGETVNEAELDYETEVYLADQLLGLENDEVNNTDKFPEDKEVVETDSLQCFHRTGEITYLDKNYVLIDGEYYFDLSGCPLQVYPKDRVSYMCYKEEDTFKVVRLLENHGPAWGDIVETQEDKYQIIEHTIIGEVENRQNRLVYMKDLTFNLDDVEAAFVPVKGDWLELKCSVQFDESKPSDISTKQVLKVLGLKALRSKTMSSTVTYWDGETGVCDNQIYFNRHSIQNGSCIQTGSKVMLEAIESNQGHCTWRAIRMLVDEVSEPSQPAADNDKEEERSLQIEQEKNIHVTHPLTFENVQFGSNACMKLIITNNSNEIHTILRWLIVSKKSDSQFNITPFLNNQVKLLPGRNFTFNITCRPKFLGSSKELMVIVFRGFQLKRYLSTNVVQERLNTDTLINGTENGQISQDQMVQNMKSVRKKLAKDIVPGVRTIRSANFIPVKLGMYPIPDKIWKAVLGDSDEISNDINSTIRRIEQHLPFLSGDLNIHNYTDIWHALLHMEEIQQNVHMRAYDMPKTFLDRHQEYLGIEIKGLAERRPSLIQGDRIVVQDIWDDKSQLYEGFVHGIRGDIVLLKFSPRFHELYSGSDVAIEFHFSRTTYRRAHQAINLAISNLGPDLLFPSRVASRPPQVSLDKLNNITWFNTHLNDGQKAAVKNVLAGECRPMPYCIYGPPGTGKTITVVEIILQILTVFTDARILVATPSNSAANLITERLIQYMNVFSGSMVRLIAVHLLESNNIPDAIKPFCATLDVAKENTSHPRHRVNHDGVNLNCQTNYVGRHRVTIGTFQCIGTLSQMGLPRGHFTHVIVDEAGQGTEPEIMIPMTFTDKDNGQIILAGDPMQLGPVVLSKYAEEFGMQLSYLERILDRFPYQKDYDAYKEGYDSRLVTKLTENYRSVEEVLELPSQMFYDGILVPKINRNEDWIVGISSVVNESFGISDGGRGGIFVYGIRGVNSRAEDSPSWYNPQEGSMLALTVCKLYKKQLSPDDIGVITPYIAQVKYLRLVFDAMGLPQPKIGTVEEFQGQEKRVILISTVRSTESHLQQDHKHALGFVKHPKRLNVAITRAQVAVLLFCNPHLLHRDPQWNKVLAYAVKNGKYSGCDLPSGLANDVQVGE